MTQDARAELAHRFQYHPPTTPGAREAHETVRARFEDLSQELSALVPVGREAAVMITKMEEAMFWANAAIARHFGSEGGTTEDNYKPRPISDSPQRSRGNAGLRGAPGGHAPGLRPAASDGMGAEPWEYDFVKAHVESGTASKEVKRFFAQCVRAEPMNP